MHVGFEAVSATTALLAILSAASDKVSLCARYGHTIEPEGWHSCSFARFSMDNGEGKGQLTMCTLEDLEAAASYGLVYNALNKAPIESAHRSRQARLDHLTPGSTMGKRKSRGEPDRSELSCLTFQDYMHLYIKEVLFRNNTEYIDPPRIEMYAGLKERTRRGVVEWLVKHHYVSSASTDLTALTVSCLPRVKAVLRADGIRIFNPCTKEEQLIPELLYRSKWLETSGHLARLRGTSRRIEAHLNPSHLGKLWVNIGGLKCLDLVTSDPHLADLCLLDWLLICADNKLRGYLSRAREVQHEVDKVAQVNAATRAGRERRRAEVALAEKPPTKTAIRRDRRANTAIEAAGVSGLPRPLPQASSVAAVVGDDSVGSVHSTAAHSPVPDTDDLLDTLASLYQLEKQLG